MLLGFFHDIRTTSEQALYRLLRLFSPDRERSIPLPYCSFPNQILCHHAFRYVSHSMLMKELSSGCE